MLKRKEYTTVEGLKKSMASFSVNSLPDSIAGTFTMRSSKKFSFSKTLNILSIHSKINKFLKKNAQS